MTEKMILEELNRIRETTIRTLNAELDRLLKMMDGEETGDLPTECTYPFTTDTNIFIGKKPVAVLFGEERIETNNWRKVYEAIIGRCNADPKCHEKLMYLRDRASGRVRKFISCSADGIERPMKVDEDMFVEVAYGTASLLHVLRDQILAYTGFDYRNISIMIKN